VNEMLANEQQLEAEEQWVESLGQHLMYSTLESY